MKKSNTQMNNRNGYVPSGHRLSSSPPFVTAFLDGGYSVRPANTPRKVPVRPRKVPQVRPRNVPQVCWNLISPNLV